MPDIPFPIATGGTVAVVLLALAARGVAGAVLRARVGDERERYRLLSMWNTLLLVFVVAATAAFWAHLLQRKATFFGLVGAGLAVALREPLLSIAGRVAILAGGLYGIGDRIEINQMTGDVIGIGFFYTRMMEIGNWVGGDQFSGRIVQFANASIFGAAVFNYTRGLSYIWDEIVVPVAQDSNVAQARRILEEAGEAATAEYRDGAERELERLKRTYYVPSYELKPQVYARITSNWLELTLRYVVDPRRRRQTSAAIHARVFERIRASEGVRLGSSTEEVTLRRAGR